MLDSLQEQGRKPFEGWVIEFELLPEQVGARTHRPNGGDESESASGGVFISTSPTNDGFLQNCAPSSTISFCGRSTLP